MLASVSTAPVITSSPSSIELGPVFGTSFSSQTHTETASAKSATEVGYGFGVMANFILSPSFSLETGLYYAPRVVGFESTASGSPGYRQETYHALELPVMGRFWIGKVFSVGVGGYTSLGVGDVTVVGSRLGFADDSIQTKSLDYGLLTGVQFRIPVTNSANLVFDTRYQYGLRDLRNAPADDNGRYLRSLKFFGGVVFGL